MDVSVAGLLDGGTPLHGSALQVSFHCNVIVWKRLICLRNDGKHFWKHSGSNVWHLPS